MNKNTFENPAPFNLRRVLDRIRALAQLPPSPRNDQALGDAHRELLRRFSIQSPGRVAPDLEIRQAVRDALAYVGGQPERTRMALTGYDASRNGPFLGVSDEGSSAPAVLRAALDSPKGSALGRSRTPLNLGVALDAERLGGIGEVVVGPDEFADVWIECANRLLMTTNVGTRANIRVFRAAPVIRLVSEGDIVQDAATRITDAFKPFAQAPGGPRPLWVFIQFPTNAVPDTDQRESVLRRLAEFVAKSEALNPALHRLGLSVEIAAGQDGKCMAIEAIDLARKCTVGAVAIDGVVRREADHALSFPGLLNYLPEDLVDEVFNHAETAQVEVHLAKQVDAQSVAREIWSGLRIARSMGLSLGKYGLFPLTLELSEAVAAQIQRWFPDWPAAPVFYADQGLVSRNEVYAGADLAKGIYAWLDTMGKLGVQIVLIDTIDKAQGWKLLKNPAEPKGLLTRDEIDSLSRFAAERGIRVLWAGGITVPQAYEFGQLGVFGIYVTTAASEAIPVGAHYADDPALSTEKEPSYDGVLKVKTLLEAGFLRSRLQAPEYAQHPALKRLGVKIAAAGQDDVRLRTILPGVWKVWWKHLDAVQAAE